MYICLYVSIRRPIACVPLLYMFVCMHASMLCYVCMYIYICIHVYMLCVCVCMCMYVYVYVCVLCVNVLARVYKTYLDVLMCVEVDMDTIILPREGVLERLSWTEPLSSLNIFVHNKKFLQTDLCEFQVPLFICSPFQWVALILLFTLAWTDNPSLLCSEFGLFHFPTVLLHYTQLGIKLFQFSHSSK